MKKIKYILMLLLAGIWISACQDNDDVKPSNEGLNEFRVKEIVGRNDLWGDFKINLNYSDDRLDVGVVVNKDQDTIANLTKGMVIMKVPALSQEEIDMLEPGSEVPMISKIIYQVNRTTREETITHYKRENLQFTFDYEENYIYEFDDTLSMNKKVMKWRCFGEADWEIPLTRMVYTYEGNRIVRGEYAVYDHQWTVISHWDYSYDGDRQTRLKVVGTNGEVNMEKVFTYLADTKMKVVTTQAGKSHEITYILDVNGYVVRIEEENGNYMDMKYEAGHGNFSDFIPLSVKLQGEPYIK